MADKTMGNLLMFGAVGLAAWWVYENYFIPPASTTPVAATTPGGAVIVNSSGVVTPSAPVAPSAPTPLTSCPPGYLLYQGQCLLGPASIGGGTSPERSLEAARLALGPNSNMGMPPASRGGSQNSALSGLGWARSQGAYV